PIDYMHNICLGVTRKLLNWWINGDCKVRLSSYLVKCLSEKMISLHNNVPNEINRKPRSLDELSRFKATEFRTFFLYIGLAILKGIVDHSIYEHFILLHSAVVILCSEKHIATLGCEMASILLKTFVQHSEHLYNSEFLIYNVHCLIHLPEDVSTYGELDNFAAFPFENFLGYLLRLVKCTKQPLIQICNKLEQINKFSKQSEKQSFELNNISCLIEHCLGPTIATMLSYKQFKKVYFRDCVLTINNYSKVNCYCMIGTQVIEIPNFIKTEDTVLIIGKKFCKYESLYSYPFNSEILNIFVIEKLSDNLERWNLLDI
ncbi:hypothetical protein EAI_15691, partial [Harpegnathos saltator]